VPGPLLELYRTEVFPTEKAVGITVGDCRIGIKSGFGNSDSASVTRILLLVAGAGKNRQTGIFGKVGITGRELAEKKSRAAIGFNPTGADTISAKACVLNLIAPRWVPGHLESIAAAAQQGKTRAVSRSDQHTFLVCGRHSAACFSDSCEESPRQFVDTLFLLVFERFLWNQLSAHTKRGCPGQDVTHSGLLIDAARGHKRNLRKRRFQRADIGIASKRRAGKNLDEVGSGNLSPSLATQT